MTVDPRPPSRDTITVWLAEWQAAEDGIDVHVGQRVAWTLTHDLDEWIELLFDGARSVDLVLDTYAQESHAPVLVDVAGVVRAVEAVACRHEADGEAERGSAIATPVHSTLDAMAFGTRASLDPTGYILTLEVDRA